MLGSWGNASARMVEFSTQNIFSLNGKPPDRLTPALPAPQPISSKKSMDGKYPGALTFHGAKRPAVGLVIVPLGTLCPHGSGV